MLTRNSNFSFAFNASCTVIPVAKTVASFPSPICTPLPISNLCSFLYITSLGSLHSLKYTGPSNFDISSTAHLVCAYNCHIGNSPH